MDKHTLRKQMLGIRRNIPAETKAKKSLKICEMIIREHRYSSADILYAFLPYNGEPDIVPILEDAWKQGKTVVVPKVYGDIMEFIRIESLTELASGAWGIREPISDDVFHCPADAAAVMLVPGTAFTEGGDRMGYGRGYYDKYLSDFSVYTIGICYEEQIVDTLPTEPTDHKLDKIISA